MLLLMLLPALLGLGIVLMTRSGPVSSQRVSIRGVWLLIPVVVITVAANIARGMSQQDHAINRIEGALVLAASMSFMLLNIHAVRGPLSTLAVVGTSVGGAMNAAAALIFGGMPVLRASARVAGYDFGPGKAPPSDYVFSDHLGLGAILIGDFIPIPHFLKVLSIGDLLLLPGLVALVIIAVRNLRVTGETSGVGATNQGVPPDVPGPDAPVSDAPIGDRKGVNSWTRRP